MYAFNMVPHALLAKVDGCDKRPQGRGVIALIMVVVAKNVKRLDASDILRDQAVRYTTWWYAINLQGRWVRKRLLRVKVYALNMVVVQ